MQELDDLTLLRQFAADRSEVSFDQPILDRTGLTGNYDVSLDVSFGNGTSESDAVRQSMSAQPGLELTPAASRLTS
jgi:uncharacterized protein (TIGR03435 family)